jgi:hypothetical protein
MLLPHRSRHRAEWRVSSFDVAAGQVLRYTGRGLSVRESLSGALDGVTDDATANGAACWNP